MKPLMIWALVILWSCQSALFAQAFDKEKLTTLKPLCSERINKQSSDYKNNRLLAVGTLTLVGIGLFPLDISGTIDNKQLGSISVGLISLIGGTMAFFSPGNEVVQNKTFWSLGLTGMDKEVAAYAIMKNNAAQSKDDRKGSGILLIASGIGVILLTAIAAGATQPYKESMYLGAAFNIVLGLRSYLNPGPSEKEMEEIDKEVGVSL